MRRPIFRLCAILQIGLMILTGCHPTQPFYIQRDASLANYIAQSTDIEYADVHIDSLPEATDTLAPFGPRNLPEEYIDLSLEDCISMALNNTKVMRSLGGYNSQTGQVSAALLAAQPGQMPSIYDPAIVSSTSSTQALAVDSQGTRVAQRGAVRANQVGGVEDALAEFDTQFSALFGYNTTDRPRNVDPTNPFNPQQFQAFDGNGQMALSKRHATGTITTARFTTVYSRNNIPAPGVGRQLPSDYTAALELQINQPLMRGRGTLVNRIPVMLARMNEEIATHEFEINVRNLLQSIEHAYWDLYCAYRAYDAAVHARDLASQAANQATEVATAGGEPAPAFNAQGRLFQFQGQMKGALYGSRVPGFNPEGIFGAERRLRSLIGWGATDGRCIRPSDRPSIARVHFNWHEVVGEALVRNTEVRRQKWAIKQDELELISARNQVLPQLDLVGFYRWLGVGDHLASSSPSGARFPAAGTSAIEELLGGDYQEVGARVEFTPQAFGKRRALANITFTQLQLKKSQVEAEEKEIMLVFELAAAFARIDGAYDMMHEFWQQASAHENEIKAYERQLERGVGNRQSLLDLLLRAEELRARAELQYHQAICEYNKEITNLHLLKGSLLDLNGITLQEGAWVDKAYWDAEERAKERAGGIYFDYGYTRPGVVSNGPTGGEVYSLGDLNEGGVVLPQSSTGPEEIEAAPSVMENGGGQGDSMENGQADDSTTQASYHSGSTSFDWGDVEAAAHESPRHAPKRTAGRSSSPEAIRPSAGYRLSDQGAAAGVPASSSSGGRAPAWTRR
ncbi:MAG TPA: transporter [Planctomycetaceae bacterium]|nr:transporter [Planctomycetaceae bacterium]